MCHLGKVMSGALRLTAVKNFISYQFKHEKNDGIFFPTFFVLLTVKIYQNIFSKKNNLFTKKISNQNVYKFNAYRRFRHASSNVSRLVHYAAALLVNINTKLSKPG